MSRPSKSTSLPKTRTRTPLVENPYPVAESLPLMEMLTLLPARLPKENARPRNPSTRSAGRLSRRRSGFLQLHQAPTMAGMPGVNPTTIHHGEIVKRVGDMALYARGSRCSRIAKKRRRYTGSFCMAPSQASSTAGSSVSARTPRPLPRHGRSQWGRLLSSLRKTTWTALLISRGRFLCIAFYLTEFMLCSYFALNE